ncbi:DoxX family protein [Actinomycetes bacterium M1A6_2h]
MNIVAIVIDVFLAIALTASAAGKLTKNDGALKAIRSVGFPDDKIWLLAVAEIAGAVGLIIGIFWAPLAIAAAIGVVLYFLGAVIGHLRVKDGQFGPAAFLGVVAVAAVIVNSIAA